MTFLEYFLKYILLCSVFFAVTYGASLLIRRNKSVPEEAVILNDRFSPEKRKDFSALFIFIIYYFIHLIAPYAVSLLGNRFISEHVNLIFFTFMLILVIILGRKFLWENVKRVNEDSKNKFSIAIIGFFIYIISLIIVSILLKQIFDMTSLEKTIEDKSTVSNLSFLEKLIVGCLFAPIIEEVVYRGIIFRLYRKQTKIFAHIVSAIIFGAMHYIDWFVYYGNFLYIVYTIPLMLMGLLYSIIYEKTGNICWPMLLHFMNNFMSII